VRSLAVSCWLCHHGAVLPVDPWPDDVTVPSFGRSPLRAVAPNRQPMRHSVPAAFPPTEIRSLHYDLRRSQLHSRSGGTQLRRGRLPLPYRCGRIRSPASPAREPQSAK
jgi:hypothetical protein